MVEHNSSKACPKCKAGELRQKIYVRVDCPTGQRSLDKTAIRESRVQIEAVLWDHATIYCTNCAHILRYGEWVNRKRIIGE